MTVCDEYSVYNFTSILSSLPELPLCHLESSAWSHSHNGCYLPNRTGGGTRETGPHQV